MNRKVLWSMIALLWGFLIGFVILKLFFAQEFLAVMSNPRIIQIGRFIDSHSWATVLADTILSSLAMHFYLCACKRIWHLSVIEYISLIVYVFVLVLVYKFNATLGMIMDLCGMILIPVSIKLSTKHWVSIFILHQAGQILTLFVRSEPLYLASTDYATQLILVFDLYVWLVLYYLYSNLYKEESIWENLLCPFSEITRKLSSKRKSQK
jgi:hypothetical protein